MCLNEAYSEVHIGKKFICCIQILQSSCFLPKNVKIEIYKTIILPHVSYGCETWSHHERIQVD